MSDLALSEEELYELTRYRRASKQMAVLKKLGIPCLRRADNTVLVMRMHCTYPTGHDSRPGRAAPSLKSERRRNEPAASR